MPTPAQRRAKDKYDAKTYKELRIKPKIEEAERITAHAEGRGESLTRFLVRSAENQIALDNQSKEELLRALEENELLEELDALIEKE